MMLRRLKCWLDGHRPDHDAPEALARPGLWWCARCRRYYPGNGPMPPRHMATLRANGWTRGDLEDVGHQYLPAAEMLRFMRSIYDQREAPSEQAAARGYAEGFQAGYEKAMLEGFKGDRL